MIDERILISETTKNQHCNGGRGKSRNCPNSFGQDCSFDKACFLDFQNVRSVVDGLHLTFLFQPPGLAGPFSAMPEPPDIPDDLKNECKVT